MTWVFAAIIALFSAVGVVLTMLTLPGTWLIILVAGVCWLVQRDLYSWPIFALAIGVALIGEVIEFAASAAGAAKAGGGRSGAIGSLIGSIAGAILGTPVMPIIGTILGAAIGAGVGAIVGEKLIAKRDWKDSAKIGAGAATGRLVAVVVKSACAGLIGAILTIAAVI